MTPASAGEPDHAPRYDAYDSHEQARAVFRYTKQAQKKFPNDTAKQQEWVEIQVERDQLRRDRRALEAFERRTR